MALLEPRYFFAGKRDPERIVFRMEELGGSLISTAGVCEDEQVVCELGKMLVLLKWGQDCWKVILSLPFDHV